MGLVGPYGLLMVTYLVLVRVPISISYIKNTCYTCRIPDHTLFLALGPVIRLPVRERSLCATLSPSTVHISMSPGQGPGRPGSSRRERRTKKEAEEGRHVQQTVYIHL